jgi:hypothetical protein
LPYYCENGIHVQVRLPGCQGRRFSTADRLVNLPAQDSIRPSSRLSYAGGQRT